MNKIMILLNRFWNWLLAPERAEAQRPIHAALIVYPRSYFAGYEEVVREYTLYLVHDVYGLNVRPEGVDVRFKDNIDRPQAFFVCPSICADDVRLTFEAIMELVVKQAQPAASGYLPIDMEDDT